MQKNWPFEDGARASDATLARLKEKEFRDLVIVVPLSSTLVIKFLFLT